MLRKSQKKTLNSIYKAKKKEKDKAYQKNKKIIKKSC